MRTCRCHRSPDVYIYIMTNEFSFFVFSVEPRGILCREGMTVASLKYFDRFLSYIL